MSIVIEGIKIKLKGVELSEHLGKRVKHHQEKAQHQEKQLKHFDDEDQDYVREHGISKYNNDHTDPRTSIKQSIQQHKNRAELLSFLLGKMDVTADYVLNEADLQKLEFIKSYF